MLKYFILDRFSLIDLMWFMLFGIALGKGYMILGAAMLLINLGSIYLQSKLGEEIGILPLTAESRNDIVNQHFSSKKPE